MPHKYKTSRVGRKLHNYDDVRMLAALPKHVPERTWVDVLQKEERELIALEMREVVLEETERASRERHVSEACAGYAVRSATLAWDALLRLRGLARGKPRETSRPSPPPSPSPADSTARAALPLDVPPEASPSLHHERRTHNDIPRMYWFPGKVRVAGASFDSTYASGEWGTEVGWCCTPLPTDSEVLQKVTDYGTSDEPLQTSAGCGCAQSEEALSLYCEESVRRDAASKKTSQ